MQNRRQHETPTGKVLLLDLGPAHGRELVTPLCVPFQGFKLGVRVADSLVLILNTALPNDVLVLHNLKNIAHTMETMRTFGAFGINGITYAP